MKRIISLPIYKNTTNLLEKVQYKTYNIYSIFSKRDITSNSLINIISIYDRTNMVFELYCIGKTSYKYWTMRDLRSAWPNTYNQIN